MRALIFDLDGTLIDSTYAHAIAWQRALDEGGFEVPAWEIHRRIGISGELLVKTLGRQRGRRFGAAAIDKLGSRHLKHFKAMQRWCKPLPGAVELLRFLRRSKVIHGIASTGKRKEIAASLKTLSIAKDVPVLDADAIQRAKPEPDLFVACQKRLGVPKPECLVVGDSVWDIHAARRAGIAVAGVLTGGFSEQELYNAGAMRVYEDVGKLHRCIDELGLELP